MPPASTVQPGAPCVWLVVGIIFLLLVTGGILLILYMVLPNSKSTMAFPIAGIILVGVPWAFWFFTCLHRFTKPKRPRTAKVSPAAPNAEATTAKNNDLPGKEAAMEEGMGNKNMNRETDNKTSSHASHESEIPLAFSTS